jgi:hypothetical protein
MPKIRDGGLGRGGLGGGSGYTGSGSSRAGTKPKTKTSPVNKLAKVKASGKKIAKARSTNKSVTPTSTVKTKITYYQNATKNKDGSLRFTDKRTTRNIYSGKNKKQYGPWEAKGLRKK